MIVGPRIARAHSNGDARVVNYLLFASAHLKLWPSLLVLGALALFGDVLLGVFGPEYRSHVSTVADCFP